MAEKRWTWRPKRKGPKTKGSKLKKAAAIGAMASAGIPLTLAVPSALPSAVFAGVTITGSGVIIEYYIQKKRKQRHQYIEHQAQAEYLGRVHKVHIAAEIAKDIVEKRRKAKKVY